MVTRVMRYQLSWVGDGKTELTYNDICRILWNISDEVRKASNRAVQLWWEFDHKNSEYYKEHGEYLEYKEMYGETLYKKLSNEFTLSNTSVYSAVDQAVEKRMKDNKTQMWRGEYSIPSYRSNQPIPVKKQNLKLEQQGNGDYHVKLDLLSTSLKKECNIPSGIKSGELCRFLITGRLSASSKAILDRCVSGEYNIGESKLIYDKRKKKWFINLTYQFNAKENLGLDKKRILGVDLGVVHATHMAVSDIDWDGQRFIIEGGEITAFRNQIEARRRSMQRQIRTAGDGRRGHGRKRALRPIETLSEKASNFRKTTNFRYAKRIVDVALENKCGIIQMENLQGVSKEDSFLQRNWMYYDLQTKIENCAEKYGIKVQKVDPRYTSQRCHKCGWIDSENRPSQAQFCCQSCGWKGNADFNAAKNLATAKIEKIIADSLKKQNKKQVRTTS